MKKTTVWMLAVLWVVSILVLGGYVITKQSRTDHEAPVITIETGELAISVEEAESGLMQGVTAWDNKDGDVTDSLLVESLYGIHDDAQVTVTYAAFDKAGNVTKAERTVRFTNYESPRFSLSRALVYELGSVVDVMNAVSVEDILEGDISQRLKATMLSHGVSVTAEGTHEVQFRATNSLGDTAELILPVEVYPIDSYDAELTLTEYLIYLPRGAAFRPEVYLDTLETRQDELELWGTLPEGVTVKVDNKVQTNTPGVYSVTYTVSFTDSRGEEFTGYSRLMVVVEE